MNKPRIPITTEKSQVIVNQITLLLSIFGAIAVVVIFLSGLYKNLNNFIYPVLFVVAMTIFGLSVLWGIEYIKGLREDRFFSKIPFSEIEKRTIRKTKTNYSKFEFPKVRRIINLNGVEYAVEYYDDIFKIPISDVLLVYDLSKGNFEPTIINYKERKFTELELLKAISDG